MNTRKIQANGITHNLIDEGEGFPVVMIHGFPDTSALWRKQIPTLVEAGFRCIAPDMRGRGDTDMPATPEEYSLHHPIDDVKAIMDALDIERAHVVCHDWGAVVGWLLATFDPARVERLVAISVGAPGAAPRSLKQMARFWYMLLFQFPVAEELVQRDDWAFFREWGGAHNPDLERYITDLSRPGRLTAGLNWYRANAKPEILLAPAVNLPKVSAPTMGVWSTADLALGEEQMTASASVVANEWRFERLEDIGHWIPVEAADQLNALLLDFLAP